MFEAPYATKNPDPLYGFSQTTQRISALVAECIQI
jgi:hypothetical protein